MSRERELQKKQPELEPPPPTEEGVSEKNCRGLLPGDGEDGEQALDLEALAGF